MFDFLDNPWLNLMIYGILGPAFLLFGFAGMPSKWYNKGRKSRTLGERWSRTPRQSKWMIVIGVFATISALATVAELVAG